jgi:putative MFS transporter
MSDPVAISITGFALVTSIYTFVTLGLYGYIPELFPTALRLRGTGFAAVCGRAASMFTPYATVALFQNFGLSGVLSMVMGILSLLIVALLVLRVETSQQSLEEIGTGIEEDVMGMTAVHADH